MNMKHSRDKQDRLIAFLIEKKYRIQRHALVWLYLTCTEFRDHDHETGTNVRIFLYMSAIYVNMYVLIPKLLLKDMYFRYLITLLSIIFVSYVVPGWLYIYYFNDSALTVAEQAKLLFSDAVGHMNLLTMAVFSSTAIKLLQRWKIDSTRINDLEKNSLQIELRELKNQISPHFLFNMLNNVNVLIQKDRQKASTVVMKLSEFLRYQLYETSSGSVSLQSEIKFLKDFIELEKIRRDDFSFSVSDENPAGSKRLLLPPGLFLTFVENAVKHSADPEAPSLVNLSFSVAQERLQFTCINTKPREPSFRESGGLGLANITRRLDLLYSKDYTLDIQDQPDLYKVDLSIPI